MGTDSFEFAIRTNVILLSCGYHFARIRQRATRLETGFDWFGKSSEESLHLGVSPHSSALQLINSQALIAPNNIDCRLAGLPGVLELHTCAFLGDRFC